MQYQIERTIRFRDSINKLDLKFGGYIYNPLDYAWESHRLYLEKWVGKKGVNLFLGMNPGPFGMAQTGVPFGEVNAARGFLGCAAPVAKPVREHPARPVAGYSVSRSEVSGLRLWGLIEEHFGTAENFFSGNTVMNYCPLAFLDGGETAKNITPDKLEKASREALTEVCDSYLKDMIDFLEPRFLIGVGKYAEDKLRAVSDRTVLRIIHPSPGNPQANNNWSGKTLDCLVSNGVWK